MITPFILSQIIGGIALIFDIFSFQFKKREHILLVLVISSILISTHFFLLSQVLAGSMIVISVFRFITAYFTTSKKALALFLAITVIVSFSTYVEPINLLAAIATLILTTAAFQQDDKNLRRIMMVGTSIWIIHNIIVFTPALIIIESIFLTSNIIGYYRHHGTKRPITPV